MDGENHGKPYEQMDDLGWFPLFLETPSLFSCDLGDKSIGKKIVQKSFAHVSGAASLRISCYITLWWLQYNELV